uniref:Uncharacterized protein n=1 Tax=Ditylenchus dipsaci TaxID=166011 RepID=A0A915EQ73_9BILA
MSVFAGAAAHQAPIQTQFFGREIDWEIDSGAPPPPERESVSPSTIAAAVIVNLGAGFVGKLPISKRTSVVFP